MTVDEQQLLKKMAGTLYGNGQEGLTVKVGKLQTLSKIILATCTAILISIIATYIKN